MFSPRLRFRIAIGLAGAVFNAGFGTVSARQTLPVAGRSEAGKSRQEQVLLFDSGKKAYEDGEYSRAETLLKQGLKLAETDGARAWQADFLNLIGLVYYRRGNSQQAMEYYRRALAFYQNYGSSDAKVLRMSQASAASVLNNMGNAADGLGRVLESLGYKQQALTIREQIGDQSKIADSYNAVGIAFEHLNQYNKALDYYGRAMKLYESLQDQQGIAYACNNMGNVYDAQGEYERR